jgi:hypothetical protein
MQDGQDRERTPGRQTIAVIAAAVIVVLGLLALGPWNSPHVASNPGPSGTPGSTVAEKTPPPAAGPSGGTTGSAR